MVSPSDLSARLYVLAVVASIALGVAIRASFVLDSDFPLNDGGMFFAMVRDLQASHYAIPSVTTYNSGDIPFAYPPLAFYAAAFINDHTPMGLVTIFRFLPLLMSSLTIPAFFLFARRMLQSRAAIATSVFVFALLPGAFQWMIMGGGLTRSFGFLFAILTLVHAHAMYTDRSWRRVAVAMLCASLVVLSHAEMAWLTAFSSALLFVSYGRSRFGVLATAAVAAGTLLLTAPWWGLMIERHGLAPMLAALDSGSYPLRGIFILLQFDTRLDPLFNVVAGLALLGIVASMARRHYLLAWWLVLAATLDARTFPTAAAIPMALLAAIGTHDVLLPAVARAVGAGSLRDVAPDGSRPASGRTAPAWFTGAVLTVAACYVLLSSFMATPKLLTGLTGGERDAMQWVAANTAADSRFLVMSGDDWSVDDTSEWFPVLTGRQSIATVQGSEWRPNGGFAHAQREFYKMQACADESSACLDAWSARTGHTFDYIYLTNMPPRDEDDQAETCCRILRASLEQDPHYAVVYETASATVFRRVPPPITKG